MAERIPPTDIILSEGDFIKHLLAISAEENPSLHKIDLEHRRKIIEEALQLMSRLDQLAEIHSQKIAEGKSPFSETAQTEMQALWVLSGAGPIATLRSGTEMDPYQARHNAARREGKIPPSYWLQETNSDRINYAILLARLLGPRDLKGGTLPLLYNGTDPQVEELANILKNGEYSDIRATLTTAGIRNTADQLQHLTLPGHLQSQQMAGEPARIGVICHENHLARFAFLAGTHSPFNSQTVFQAFPLTLTNSKYEDAHQKLIKQKDREENIRGIMYEVSQTETREPIELLLE